jgi:N-dimethylarginine dimethylaminohydrolase
MPLTAQSEVGRIHRLLLKPPTAAMHNQREVDAEWQPLNYLARPDYSEAVAEYNAFVDLLSGANIDIEYLPSSEQTGMDSLYVRDAAIVCDAGAILCNMGKPARRGEPDGCGRMFEQLDLMVAGAVSSPGFFEGGDVAWLNPQTLVVGRGYRTNDVGISQLAAMLPTDVELITVPLPHWQGPEDVFHLMSMLSPIDEDLLLVYSPLLPVPFRELLIERGFKLIDVPDAEFASMGCNVLAIEPRHCVMLEGNPITTARLEAAGARVLTYQGTEISAKGCGGPTCLTRPLLREI